MVWEENFCLTCRGRRRRRRRGGGAQFERTETGDNCVLFVWGFGCNHKKQIKNRRILKQETEVGSSSSSETLAPVYHNTWHHIQQNGSTHSYCCEVLKSHNIQAVCNLKSHDVSRVSIKQKYFLIKFYSTWMKHFYIWKGALVQVDLITGGWHSCGWISFHVEQVLSLPVLVFVGSALCAT